jgi:uncharacterized protein (DUF1810 family)
MDLERFVKAQDSGGAYQRAVAELRNGRKTSHWIYHQLSELTGHDLMCYCELDQPCHADVLRELANP